MDENKNTNLVIKESYQSGLKELLKNKYNLLLLDMSIPTWDISIYEPGGYFEKFGGYKILREITRKAKAIPTILITMFDDFGDSDSSITLSQLNELLASKFDKFFLGSVFYNSREINWRKNLKELIEKAAMNEDFNR